MQSYTLTNLLVAIRNDQAKDGQVSTFYMTTPPLISMRLSLFWLKSIIYTVMIIPYQHIKLPDYILGKFRAQVIELLWSHDLLKYRNTIGIPVKTGMHWISLLIIYYVIEKKKKKKKKEKTCKKAGTIKCFL